MTIAEALSWAAKKLKDFDVPDETTEAEFLLTHLLRCKRHELYLNSGKTLFAADEEAFLGYIERRANREPAQYITGETEFRGLTMKVTRDTLIPRPETELLIDEARDAAAAFKDKKGLLFIDLCTGSGCIAVAVAKEMTGCRVIATDISPKALTVARENAEMNGVASRVEFLEGDLFTPIKTGFKGRVQIVFSNPPYVPLTDKEKLAPEIRDFEPASALFGGADGLDFYRRIITVAPDYIEKGGYLILEIGFGQNGKIREMAEEDGRYGNIRIRKDYSGIERVFRAMVKV